MPSHKSGFHEPNAIKNQKPKCKPEDGKNSPWDYRCPDYDQRSSNFVNCGTHYGMGMRQPVGHKGNPKSTINTLPTNRKTVSTMRDDDRG